ncbi:MAG: ACP S-malonyltransferase [Desulfobacteraceae bacterium]|nr:MAG: ACP S-malonyltransferase [Desulfobacteraceae bacterium]
MSNNNLLNPSSDTCWEGAPEIIALSGSSRSDLENRLTALGDKFLTSPGQDDLKQFAADSRASFASDNACRLVCTIGTPDEWPQIIQEAIENLKKNTAACWSLKNIFYGEIQSPGRLAFIFPGQGSQYVNMGQDMLSCFPEARQTLLHANNIFNGNKKLTDYIYPLLDNEKEEAAVREENLRCTDVAQPAIGAVSLAIMKVLNRFGIKPDAACGHSYGELTALHAGGWFDEMTFLTLSAARGKYMAAGGSGGDKGGMLAVKAPLEKIDDLIRESNLDLVLANRNSPDQGVLSGPTDAIAQMKSICREHKIISAILPVSGAFHSRLVESAAAPFKKQIAAAVFSPSRIPVYSNTTALPYPDPEKEAKELLGGHLMNPVNFTKEIENMHHAGIRIFVEAGPRTVLTGLVKAILKDHEIFAMGVDGSSGKQSGLMDLAKMLGMLASIGYPVNLNNWRFSGI